MAQPMTEEQRAECRRRYENGDVLRVVARDLGLSISAVRTVGAAPAGATERRHARLAELGELVRIKNVRYGSRTATAEAGNDGSFVECWAERERPPAPWSPGPNFEADVRRLRARGRRLTEIAALLRAPYAGVAEALAT